MPLALHRQATRSHRPSMAMPLAAAPYRASGLVHWREADIRRSVRSEKCQCARRHHHPKDAKNYSGPKLSRTILSFSSSDQRRRARIHHLEPLDLRTALFTVHKDGSQHKPQLTRRPSAKGYGVRAVKTIPSPCKHYASVQSCPATSGHASNDKRSADISSLDSLRIKSLRSSILRWRMNDT